MKFVLSLLLAALPLAAQSTNQPDAAPDTAAPPATESGAPTSAPPATNNAAPPAFNPADAEPVVIAPPLTDTSTATNVAPELHSVPDTNFATAGLSPDPFSDPVIEQVSARHEKAVNGDKKETKALTADLERWTQDEPQNYLLLAYLGSAYTLDSRDAWPGPGKLAYLRKGGAALDAAVAGDPTNPAVRFVRALDFYELPAIFGKHRAANDDFHLLVQQLEGARPMPYILKTDTAQAIYYYAGLSDVQFSQKAAAKDAWQRGIALAPQSKLGLEMQAALDQLR